MPSLNINDATDAAHSAVMDVNAWADEFVGEWMRPQIEMAQAQTVEQVIVMFEQMPPTMKAMMQKQNPEQYAQIVKRVDELKKRPNPRPLP